MKKSGCGNRSPAARKRRNKLNKQRQALKLLHVHATEAALADRHAHAGGHHARLARAETVGFARGVAAEKAAAKERRGQRRIDKKHKQAQKQAGRRMARRRRAGRA